MLLPCDGKLTLPLLRFSYINQRNREWNIVESEKALVVSGHIDGTVQREWRSELYVEIFFHHASEVNAAFNIHVLSL